MAFTRKPNKLSGSAKASAPAPKAAASYARKKAQAEVEEAEEVEEVEAEEAVEAEAEEQDEVQDDYDDQEAPASPPPASRRGFSRPPARQGQASRQFSNSGNGGNGGNGEQKKALRLTGLFAGKREGCFSGKLRTEDAENLAALIEEANSTNQQIVFFLWENQGNPQFSLTANISAPKQFGNRGGNRGGRGGWQGSSGGNGGFRKRW